MTTRWSSTRTSPAVVRRKRKSRRRNQAGRRNRRSRGQGGGQDQGCYTWPLLSSLRGMKFCTSSRSLDAATTQFVRRPPAWHGRRSRGHLGHEQSHHLHV